MQRSKDEGHRSTHKPHDSAVGEAPVRSVENALRILDCFHEHEELGSLEVAQMVGISTSSACRLLITMASNGFLERTYRGRYRIGLQVFTLGQLAIERLRLRELALPTLARVRDAANETVQIGIPMGADVLYVDRLESRYGLRFHTEDYRRMPGATSGTGRAIAAFNDTFAQAIRTTGLQRRTPHTIVDRDQFATALDQVRKQGWSCLAEEAELGITSIAAPVLVGDGTERGAVAAISVVGPTHHLMAQKKLMVQNVCDGARSLSASLREYDHAQGTRTVRPQQWYPFGENGSAVAGASAPARRPSQKPRDDVGAHPMPETTETTSPTH